MFWKDIDAIFYIFQSDYMLLYMFHNVCELKFLEFCSYCPWMAAILHFSSKLYSRKAHCNPPPPPGGKGLVYFLASIYDGSTILGCLPIAWCRLFELWPLNGGHIGFFHKQPTLSQYEQNGCFKKKLMPFFILLRAIIWCFR